MQLIFSLPRLTTNTLADLATYPKKSNPLFLGQNRVSWEYVALRSDPPRRSPHYFGTYSWLTFVSLLFQRIKRKNQDATASPVRPVVVSASPVERHWMPCSRCCVHPCPRPARAPARHHGLVPDAAGPGRGRPPLQAEIRVRHTVFCKVAAGEGARELLEEPRPQAHHGPDGRERRDLPPCPQVGPAQQS